MSGGSGSEAEKPWFLKKSLGGGVSVLWIRLTLILFAPGSRKNHPSNDANG
jgi:hypothetical protein